MNMQYTLQHLFKKSSLEEVPLSALKELTDEHPYFAAGQLLLAKKLQQQGDADFAGQLRKTTLYFHDPLWLHHLIEEKQEDSTASVAEDLKIPVSEKTTESRKEDALLFEPYHTIDYFASLGIKPGQEPQPGDKLGNQLKSFTEWLKTLRRLPEAVAEEANGSSEPDQHLPLTKGGGGDFSHVEEIAAHSLEEKEIVTETMAEVLLLQGKREKALAVYDKLSLLNPDKKAYFAARIKELNER